MNEHLPLIDIGEARRLFESQAMGDASFYRELTVTQAEETARLLDEMEHALADNDHTVLRRVAHSFKGAGATFGLVRLKATGLDVETASRDAMPANAAELAAGLAAVARDSLVALNQFAATL